ncbi:MAG: peptide-methionine (S)-S-oxide reductase MsrA [Saprospiraceae bacterium]
MNRVESASFDIANVCPEKAIFACGCFWCTEAVFQNLKGVRSLLSGYIGGNIVNPSYRDICSGSSGHAEAIEICFLPTIISFDQLLEIFWTTHDPTTLNRQGADKGSQYRSAIFFTTKQQEIIAQNSKDTFAKELWNDPIVTEITAATTFYAAEDYHQNYFNNNPNQSYCQIVINPKIHKLRTKFADLIAQ